MTTPTFRSILARRILSLIAVSFPATAVLNGCVVGGCPERTATPAARCAFEGAIGETLSAVTAAEQMACATDPAVREALAGIAEDEARHAELAWRTVAWAIRRGGASVRSTVARVFAAITMPASDAGSLAGSPILAAHGRLGEAERQRATAQALEEIVLPAARLLLGDEIRSGAASRDPAEHAAEIR